jgi:hypothetical protein
MSKRNRHLTGWIAVCLILAGCNLGQPPAPGYQPGPSAWFDSPLPNSTFPLGPVQIVGHASDTDGLTQFEFSADGAVNVLPSPSASDSLVTFTYVWTPSGPGTYPLLLRAMDAMGNWSDYAETVVIIADEPTPTPTAAVPQASIERVSLSSEEVFFSIPTMASMPCGGKSVTLRFRATDPDGIKVVVLFYRLQSQSGSDTTEFASMAMVPLGGDMYQAALTPESLFESSLIESYGASWLQYQAVIQNNANQASARTQVFSDLALKVCTR